MLCGFGAFEGFVWHVAFTASHRQMIGKGGEEGKDGMRTVRLGGGGGVVESDFMRKGVSERSQEGVRIRPALSLVG